MGGEGQDTGTVYCDVMYRRAVEYGVLRWVCE